MAQNAKESKTVKLKIINELEQELDRFFSQLNEVDELQDENLLNDVLKILQVAA